jgi:hypothetical protein
MKRRPWWWWPVGLLALWGLVAAGFVLGRLTVGSGATTTTLAASSSTTLPATTTAPPTTTQPTATTSVPPETTTTEAVAPFPDPQDLYIRFTRHCELAWADYGLGWNLGPELYELSDALVGWTHGVRDYYCVAGVPDDYGRLVDVKGSFLGDWETAEEQLGT